MLGSASRAGNATDRLNPRSGSPGLMPPVPVLRPREVVRAFERLGWEVARQQGSHIILTKPGQIATLSVPKHPTVARGLCKAWSPEQQFLSKPFWNPSI